jgi:nucleoside-diphosphate-sugar epimerase
VLELNKSGLVSPAHLKPWVFSIEVAHKVAGIPGSGNPHAAYMYSRDVAKFVVAALSLPDQTWKESSVMISEHKSLNEILRIAELVCGDKFKVSYDSTESLARWDHN